MLRCNLLLRRRVKFRNFSNEQTSIISHSDLPQSSLINSGVDGVTASDIPSLDHVSPPLDVLKYIDSKIDLIIPVGTNQGEQCDAYSNRIGDNVNRNSNLRILFDQYKVDLNTMRQSCHLFSHGHKYGAKYIQKLSEEEFEIRLKSLDVLLTPYFEYITDGNVSDVGKRYKMIGSLIEKCPNLLNPIFNETQKWYDVYDYFTAENPDKFDINFGAESFGRIILRCPQLLTRQISQIDEAFRAIKYMATKIEPCNIFQTKKELKMMIIKDPSILLEPPERLLFRIRVLFDYQFSSGKVKRILERNPSVLTSRFNRIRPSNSNNFSDFEQHLLFLMNDCDFSLETISYNPLLLTTEKNHLVERILFLKSINRAKFKINKDPDYFPIEKMCQKISQSEDPKFYTLDGDVPNRGSPLDDLKIFCDELGIDKSEYFKFIKTL